MVIKRIGSFILSFLVIACLLCSQEYHGITGLLQVPNAEIDSSGTFRGNISWVDKAMLPDMTYYGDGIPFSAPCYTIGLTVFKWIQLSYTGTLVKTHGGGKSEQLKYYNEDRHVNLKFIPLYEGNYWPAVAVGWDDIGSLSVFKSKKSWTTNNFFEALYIAASKHFDIKGHELGAHLAYRYYLSEKNAERRGIVGGITYRPAFFKQLRGIIEWDGIGVNAGVDVLLWKRLFAQVALIHGSGLIGSLGYHYQIPF